MSRNLQRKARWAALIVAASVTLPTLAASLDEHHSGSVSYVMGGIGDEEESAIKGMMHDYSVSMTFASRRDGKAVFLADVPVAVRDAQGTIVLNVKADGPYLLVKLPPGTYTVEASHAGQTEKRSLSVSAHSSQPLEFLWS
jgi:hypothetical protein